MSARRNGPKGYVHLVALAGGATVVALLTSPAAATQSVAGTAPPKHPAGHGTSCHLGHGVKHVIEITFDNVHLFRDNPNVPSDLQQMPTLLNFLKRHGTILSNMHTPLIAHTAEDSLALYSGLYGDRHGQPVSNSYKTYNPDGSTSPASSFNYWTSPVYDTSTHAPSTTDLSPSMVYSDPAHPRLAGRTTPAPWPAFTRAGCTVGDFSTANMVLENTSVDIPAVFGAGSPEAQQLAADPDSFKDNEVADYVGVALHCAKGQAICAEAQAVKYGQSAPSHTAVADALPDQPGGYHGYQALFGARYVAPQLGAGTPNLTSHGYPVTDSHGNLTDLNGNPMYGAFTNQRPGFPGFNPTASQSLAYVADMQEAGVPVTYAYISDIHDRKPGATGCSTAGTGALGPGDPCEKAAAAAYDSAFAKFLDRLHKDGITAANTEFVIGAEENDHFDGANAGRAIQPSCTGSTCSYAAGQIGELQANLPQLLASQTGDTTPFAVEPQGAAMYVTGNPAQPQPTPNDPAVRQLERDTAALTADNPYSGVSGEKIVNYQAGATEQRILHMATADPLRTPTYTIFPKPDYYFCQSASLSACPAGVVINPGFAYNHGYYSPDIDITWTAFAGPGVKRRGIDGRSPEQSPAVADPNGGASVPAYSRKGTWADETDVRPTLLSLVGLRADYRTDGRVITQIMRRPPAGLRGLTELGRIYKQLNASVGTFGTDTLLADTAALASGSAGHDSLYTRTEHLLTQLGRARDAVALRMSQILSAAASNDARPTARTLRSARSQAQSLLRRAQQLSRHTSG
ncbi:MAG: hypothetical protein ACRDP1_05805 [Nocardioidaceae bacterium]